MTTPTFTAWIDIGKTSALFTLHRELVGREHHPMHIPYTYVRNLGRTWETACKNADKWLDANPCDHIKEYSISDEGGTLRRAGKYDDDCFWFGKYANKLIEDVIVDDPQYVFYIRDNFDSIKPRMISLIEKLEAMDLGKSEAQVEQERRDVEKAEREANKKPIPVELVKGQRYTFTGTVVFTKVQESFYGESVKMLFVDDRGFNLWGTAPTKLWDASNESPSGCKIQFDATVEVSDKDECFGFFKRPTKIVVTEESEERQADINKWNKIHEAQEEQS